MTRNAWTKALVVLCAAGAVSLVAARQQTLKNGSNESGSGPGGIDIRRAADWTFFGGNTVERSDQENLEPLGGAWSLKIFGGSATVGAYQDVPVAPGEQVEISANLYTRSTDRVGGDAAAKIKLEFLDGAQQPTGSSVELDVLTAVSPADVWTPAMIGPIAAPAGAASARFTCVWTYSVQSAGSAYWDDCRMMINGGANELLNGTFEEAGTSENTPFGIDFFTGFGTQEKSDVRSLDGDFSAKVSVGGDTGSQYSGLYQNMADAEAGERLFLKSWIYNPATDGLSGSVAAAIKLEFFPAGGLEIPPAEEALDFDENGPLDVWTQISYMTTVPNGITQARIVMIANDTSTTNGPIYFELASATGTAQGGERLLNNSFEGGSSVPNGLTFWTEFRGIGCQARKNAFEVPAIDGSSVLKISGSCVAGVYQDVQVFPGETLTVSAWLRSRSDMPFNDPASTAGVKVEWRAGAVPGQIDIGGPTNTISASAAQNQWHPVYIDFTMPPGSAAGTRFTVIAGQGSVTGVNVYFDSSEAVVLNRFDGADVDGDNDQDLLDFALLQTCFSGSGGGLGWPCLVYDQDDDQDVDQNDSNFFFPRLTGPAN